MLGRLLSGPLSILYIGVGLWGFFFSFTIPLCTSWSRWGIPWSLRLSCNLLYCADLCWYC
ncbi:hypothetical protein MKHDV_02629 [Halodesulfovibrio sp. MK-HDV]|nr:hypothetical protein MKHDV_02629 [Halodesulfovibrio sp. MK-HDV]